jgi:Kef-type K+ transport system membrane component KefB
MSISPDPVTSLILLIGGLVAVATALRVLLDRTHFPALVGFMALGMLLRVADENWHFLSEQGDYALELLAELGIIVLLFRIGLESDLSSLRKQLGPASLVWAGNVALSGVPAYAVMTMVLGYGQIPSLIAAVALTATSIGVSLCMWRQQDALKSREGQLLTDVAELDDLSGIVLMALVLAVVPVLRDAGDAGHASLLQPLTSTGALLLAKFGIFAGSCVAFARYGEERLTLAFKRTASEPELMVLVAGIAILIAGFAAWLGFSAALGALFAGLAFSRDPEAVHIDAGFGGLHHLLAPFFFIGIGLALDPGALGSALGVAALLGAVAIAGKIVGAGLPALFLTGWSGAALIGVSLVPRAEITMIVMERGRQLGDWAVPPDLYAAFIAVSALTCILSPIALRTLFGRMTPDPKGT